MTTRIAGSTSANWGQACQTTAIGCWETNVVLSTRRSSLPSTESLGAGKRRGNHEWWRRRRLRRLGSIQALLYLRNFDASPEDYYSRRKAQKSYLGLRTENARCDQSKRESSSAVRDCRRRRAFRNLFYNIISGTSPGILTFLRMVYVTAKT